MKQDTTGKLSRRTALRAIGATGVAVGFGTGVGAAQPDHAGRRGAEQRKREHEQNRPGHKDFECPEGMDHLGTFEFVVEEDADGNIVDCYFELTEGEEGLVEITGFDSKDGEECEPIVVYYESDSHEVGQISSFGGMDTHVDDDPEDGVYESDLENRGGQQAAISLLHLCGTELEEDTDDDADDGDNGDDDTNGDSDDGNNGDDDTNGDSDDADDDESDVETA